MRLIEDLGQATVEEVKPAEKKARPEQGFKSKG